MVNYFFIRDRLNLIRTSVARLQVFSHCDCGEFTSNPDNYAIAEHHLRRALEALFDIGRHIVAKRGLKKPESYHQVIQTLGVHQIIPFEFSERISGMAGYRNRITHGYADISPEELWSIIQSRLPDFEEFYSSIILFLENQE